MRTERSGLLPRLTQPGRLECRRSGPRDATHAASPLTRRAKRTHFHHLPGRTGENSSAFLQAHLGSWGPHALMSKPPSSKLSEPGSWLCLCHRSSHFLREIVERSSEEHRLWYRTACQDSNPARTLSRVTLSNITEPVCAPLPHPENGEDDDDDSPYLRRLRGFNE